MLCCSSVHVRRRLAASHEKLVGAVFLAVVECMLWRLGVRGVFVSVVSLFIATFCAIVAYFCIYAVYVVRVKRPCVLCLHLVTCPQWASFANPTFRAIL